MNKHMVFDYLFQDEANKIIRALRKTLKINYPEIKISFITKKTRAQQRTEFYWYSVYWCIKDPEQEVYAGLKYGLETINKKISQQNTLI